MQEETILAENRTRNKDFRVINQKSWNICFKKNCNYGKEDSYKN